MTKQPPLKALQAFEALGRLGSVTAAASELNVTPGAISQQLRKAEEFLAIRLFERHGRSISLTSWGKIYHEEIMLGFDKLRNAHEKVLRLKTQSELALSCLPSLANKWIGPKLFDWQLAHPGAQVRVLGTEAEPRLGEEPIDFRISYGNQIKQFDHYVELFTDWVVPACSPAYLKRKGITQAKEVLDCSLLSIEWVHHNNTAPNWTDWARSIGVDYLKPSSVMSFSLSSSAIDAAINERGFVLAQLAMIHDDLKSGRLVVPFDNRLRLFQAYFLAWDRAALSKPFGPELRAWIVSISKKQAIVSAGEDALTP